MNAHPISSAACALLLMSFVSTAWAQPKATPKPTDEALVLRKRAEDLERVGKHIACAETYMEIYRLDPRAPQVDELLYNAGVCYEMGKSAGLAIQAYSLLEKRSPLSPRARRAIVRRASLAASLIDYRQAAEAYELYARHFPLEKDAPDALQNAITYRKALGHIKEAIANTELFVKFYYQRRKAPWAAAVFSLAGLREQEGDERATLAAYKRYIKEVGKSGGTDRLVIANARVGEILWRQSCPGQEDETGACLRVLRLANPRTKANSKAKAKTKLATRCGPDSILRIVQRPRKRAKAKEATKFFDYAVKLAQRGGAFPGLDASRKAAVFYWMGAARFTLLEANFEKFLAIEFPKGLSFSPRNAKKKRKSEERFNEWISSTKKDAEELSRLYGELKKLTGGGPTWAIAAAARHAQISQHFTRLLVTAEIPREVRTGPLAEDGIDAFCNALTSAAAPLEEAAIAAFAFALDLGKKTSQFNKWSRLSERELSQLRPEGFPYPTEHHGASNAVGDILDLEALESEWPPELERRSRPGPSDESR